MLARVNDIERLFGALDLFGYGTSRRSCGCSPAMVGKSLAPSRTPRVNIYDTDDSFEVKMEMAGFAKEDVHITLHGNELFIEANREAESAEGYKAHRQERIKRTLSRKYTLPSEVSQDAVQAHLEDGILSITIAKAEGAKPREITIH